MLRLWFLTQGYKSRQSMVITVSSYAELIILLNKNVFIIAIKHKVSHNGEEALLQYVHWEPVGHQNVISNVADINMIFLSSGV